MGKGSVSSMAPIKPPGGSVFLVEDEVMIRMMVADMLEELGYSIAAESGDIDQALMLAQTTDFDIAILDVNVNGKVITEPMINSPIVEGRVVLTGMAKDELQAVAKQLAVPGAAITVRVQ